MVTAFHHAPVNTVMLLKNDELNLKVQLESIQNMKNPAIKILH